MPEPVKSEISDSELLRLHLEGDGEAFATLIGRYRRELFSFLRRFTGSDSLADDVFQETFLQLHLSAGTFDTNRRLKPWLFTIAANKARDAMRSRSRRGTVSLDALIPSDSGEKARYTNLMPAEIPQPDESLANLETRRIVQTIVLEMPENLRSVLLLSYFHAFAYRDIADMLNVPLGTVKSRLHTALVHFARKFKARMGRDEHD